jgi:hypothetical protein
LHVLSTPPAFVLSQDQTLHRDLGGASPPSIGRAGLQGHHPVGRLAPERTLSVLQCIDFATTCVAARTGFWLSSVPFSRSTRAERTRHQRRRRCGNPLWAEGHAGKPAYYLDAQSCSALAPLRAPEAAFHSSTPGRGVKPPVLRWLRRRRQRQRDRQHYPPALSPGTLPQVRAARAGARSPRPAVPPCRQHGERTCQPCAAARYSCVPWSC